MATVLSILAVTSIAGYCVGKYYGKTPAKDKDESQEKDKD